MSARILVVDDMPANLDLLEAILSKQNYEIETARSGDEALARLERFDPQVALIDVMMPGMNGYELCRRLRSRCTASYLPIIFVTASEVTQQDIVEGFATGGDDYVCKPFDTRVLLSRIAACLRVKALQDRLTRVQSELAHYVSRSTLQMVTGRLSGDSPAESRKADVTILFSDIRDFTHQTEHMAPEEVFEVLNGSLGFQLDLIAKHGGVVDKLSGDEIMAVFEGERMADRAIACATEIVEVRKSTARLGRLEHPKLGIGINSGTVYLGSVGNSRTMFDYTIVGAPVNIAARLCGMARDTQVLISRHTMELLQGDLPNVRSIGGQRLKGLSAPLEIFEYIETPLPEVCLNYG
ncbi:MAG: response regulator [Pseudohongiellaceae bacterium]